MGLFLWRTLTNTNTALHFAAKETEVNTANYWQGQGLNLELADTKIFVPVVQVRPH